MKEAPTESARAFAEPLARLGGKIQFFVQRCLYCYQYPSGESGQPFLWSDADADAVATITGAIVDLLVASGGYDPHAIDATLAQCAGTLRLVVNQAPGPACGGLRLLEAVSHSIDVRSIGDRQEIVIVITGASLVRGLGPRPVS
jgi:hypothetical protein